LAEPLKVLGTRYEEIRKRHIEYAEKLEKERDNAFSDLKKTKAKYDASCQEVESRRKKAESAFDYSKSKAQNAYQQQITDMHNVKNTYVINIKVTNKQKEKYYNEYVPDLLDSLQDLHEFRTVKLNVLWTTAAQLEGGMLKRRTDFINHLLQEIPRNLPVLDTMMFVRHNVTPWQEPPDRIFEPSPVWHDDDDIVIDDAAKVFLRNMLSKSKGQLGELRREVDKKRREIEGIKKVKQQIREGKDKRDEVQVVSAMFAMQEELHKTDHQRLTAEVETATITAAVGDVTLGAKSHNFKSQTFKIPTNCDLCGDRIWGLSAKGFDCRDCGYTCHSKCEMKVPAECPGEQSKEDRKKLKAQRQEAANAGKAPSSGQGDGASEAPSLERSNTMNSLSSGYAASANRSISGAGPRSPTEETPPDRSSTIKPATTTSASNVIRKNRIVAPPPTAYISELPGSSANGSSALSPPGNEQKGKMLYQYDANGEGEITVPDGREVTILEPDGKSQSLSCFLTYLLTSHADGSGWMKVRAGFKEGLVPASYVEPIASTSTNTRPSSTYSNSGSSAHGSLTKKKGPAVAPKRGAKKLKYVEALYDYTAASEAEHSMVEGERFLLIKEDPGDGWAEVEKGGVTKSVPANYVQAA
jgi:formin-binding protein 1